MDAFRLRIRGGAVCGKSLVAREAYGRAVSKGRRPFLTCFNRTSVERLKASVRDYSTCNFTREVG